MAIIGAVAERKRDGKIVGALFDNMDDLYEAIRASDRLCTVTYACVYGYSGMFGWDDESKNAVCTGDWDDVNVGLSHASDEGELDEYEREELTTLQAFASECENDVSDWEDGATLIRDSYFEDYAREFAEGCGYMQNSEGQSWPYNCIDWVEAADQLQSDYTSVKFDGVTYWVR